MKTNQTSKDMDLYITDTTDLLMDKKTYYSLNNEDIRLDNEDISYNLELLIRFLDQRRFEKVPECVEKIKGLMDEKISDIRAKNSRLQKNIDHPSIVDSIFHVADAYAEKCNYIIENNNKPLRRLLEDIQVLNDIVTNTRDESRVTQKSKPLDSSNSDKFNENAVLKKRLAAVERKLEVLQNPKQGGPNKNPPS